MGRWPGGLRSLSQPKLFFERFPSSLSSLIASAHVRGSVFFYASLCCYQSTTLSKWEQSALDVNVIWQAAAVLQTQGHTKLCFCGFGGLIIYTMRIIWPASQLGTFLLPSCESGLVVYLFFGPIGLQNSHIIKQLKKICIIWKNKH